MNLWLMNYLYTNNMTVERFFRSAYIWYFGKDADVWNDAATFRIHGILPKYVCEYIRDIEENET